MAKRDPSEMPRRASKRAGRIGISLLLVGLVALGVLLLWLSGTNAAAAVSALLRGGVDPTAAVLAVLAVGFGFLMAAAVLLVAVGGAALVFSSAPEPRSSGIWRILAYVVFAAFALATAWVVVGGVLGQILTLAGRWNSLGSWGILASVMFLIIDLALAGILAMLARMGLRGFDAHYRSDFRGEMLPRFRELGRSLHLIRRSPLTMVGLILIILLVVVALFAQFAPNLIVPYPQDAGAIYYPVVDQPPSAQHLFGTDELGRDYFSRVVMATPLDLQISVLVVGSALLIGICLGIIAGFKGGWIDEALMRITDIFLSIPGLILAIAFSAALGGGIVNVMVALVIVWWPGYTRIIRAQALSIRENLYVEAARAVGAKTGRIIFRHVLPNALAPVLVNATLDLGGVILVAAALGYLGLGQPPPWPEWGRLIADGQSTVLRGEWWLATFPGLAILTTSLSFNLVGDGLRDILDPRLRR